MGQDKSLLLYQGRTLAEIVAGAVREAAGTVSLVGGERHAALRQFDFIPDLYPGEGPLGGIITALHNSRADWNLIVACDMTGLRVDFLRTLLDTAAACEADALVPAGPSGRLEPLCAVYHRRALAGLERAFADGVRQISTALEQVRTAAIPVTEVAYFQNVNTPEEWANYGR